ncbi:MAG: prepilin-type N-terminal cleavage/methylation domain-containing protein [Proteobacteria bacterium]|nr:prepilin-type N-terminal cleavage/methylation domain-containing protein [Pseudomonadota bacterium]MBU1737288.1 prepilin-type N-terminal cleavage/methylation domain-containing protein [Pseudomonadota bacterium]
MNKEDCRVSCAWRLFGKGASFRSRPKSGDRVGRGETLRRMTTGRAGFTLFELLIAMFMMVLVSTMLYSILNAGISFSGKGEERIISGERDRAFLELLHRQIHGTWFGSGERKLKILVEEDTMRLVTTSPLLNRDVPMVMAFYYYDRGAGNLYYSERVDFYNPEYFEDYDPDLQEMFVLLEDLADFAIEYDEKEGIVSVSYGGQLYEFVPRCWSEEVAGS